MIHVGDYYYRESPCSAAIAGCAGSPFGDNWGAWRADFFAAADPLLKTAPWVFVRGNHEICSRGGEGWNRILAPYAFDPSASCKTNEEPYVLKLPGLSLAVVDVSEVPSVAGYDLHRQIKLVGQRLEQMVVPGQDEHDVTRDHTGSRRGERLVVA